MLAGERKGESTARSVREDTRGPSCLSGGKARRVVMFNPLVFADQGLLGRLDELIATAGQVLATRKPNPPNMLTFPTLDEQAFTEWQTQCLTFLTHLYGDDYVYVERFRSTVQRPDRGSVRAGRGILAVVREDVATAPRADIGEHRLI